MIRPVRVARIDVRYRYPEGLGLADRVDEDAGDVYGPSGTTVDLTIVTDKAVTTGALTMADGSRVPLAGGDTTLTASLPTLTVVEPLVAVLVGVTMLDETMSAHGAAEWVAVALATVAMLVSTVQLSRSAARFDELHEHELADVLTRDAPARTRVQIPSLTPPDDASSPPEAGR